MNIVWGFVIIARGVGGGGGGDAVRPAFGARGQLLRGRRSRVGGLRRAGDRVLGAARVHRLPRLRELRPVAQRRRAGGAGRGAAGRERAVLPAAGCSRADRTSSSVTGARSSTASGSGCARARRGMRSTPGACGCFAPCRAVEPKTAVEQSAYDKWLDQTSAREEARLDRIHGAVGVIPAQLWIVLFFIAGVIFVYMLFFADSGERAVVQGMLMGSVVAVMTVLLVVAERARQPVPPGGGRAGTGRDGALAADHRRGARRRADAGAAAL